MQGIGRQFVARSLRLNEVGVQICKCSVPCFRLNTLLGLANRSITSCQYYMYDIGSSAFTISGLDCTYGYKEFIGKKG